MIAVDLFIEEDLSRPPCIYRRRRGLWFARIQGTKTYTGGWSTLYIARQAMLRVFS